MICRAMAQPVEVAPGVLQLGTIQTPAVTESSGVSSSRNKGAFWTHNDGGLDVLYAVSTNGTALSEWRIRDVQLDNWEDLFRKGSQLYVADIGNDGGVREYVSVYRVIEPPVKRSGELRPNRIWNIRYPGDRFDAESFFVSGAYGYVIDRNPGGNGAQAYRFPLGRGVNVRFEPQFSVNVEGSVTGATISPDGKRIAVVTSAGAYLFVTDRKLPTEGTLDHYTFVSYPSSSTEGCAFTPSGLLVTGEAREILLFTDEPFRSKWKAPAAAAQ
jgi:hypothetical protein